MTFGRRDGAHVEITAENRTDRAFQSAQKNLKSFGAVSRSVLGGFGVGVTGLGVAALSAATKSAIDYGSTLVDVSRKLGVSVEALQEWNYAARQNGIAQNAAEMGLQRFVRRVAEAAQGTGELKATLDQYGISARNADGSTRDVWAVMGDLSNAIRNAESDGERLRIAFKAFDSEGAALVSVLRNGEEGLEEWRRAAGEAGIVTSETAERLKEASDTITEFNNRAKVTWAEFIGGAMEAYDYLFKADEMIQKAGSSVMNNLSPAMREAVNAQRAYNEALAAGLSDDTIQYYKDLADAKIKAALASEKAAEAFQKEAASAPALLGDESAEMKRLQSLQRQLWEDQVGPEKVMERLRTEIDLAMKAMGELERGTKEWAAAHTSALEKTIRLNTLERQVERERERSAPSLQSILGSSSTSSYGGNSPVVTETGSDYISRRYHAGSLYKRTMEDRESAGRSEAVDAVKSLAKQGKGDLKEIADGLKELVAEIGVVKQQVANAR